MKQTPISARIASRPDLVDEFATIETKLVNTLKQGGEVGALRRSFDNLTVRTMQELGLTMKPRGVDYAMAELTIAAQALSQSLLKTLAQGTQRLSETEEMASSGPAVRTLMRV